MKYRKIGTQGWMNPPIIKEWSRWDPPILMNWIFNPQNHAGSQTEVLNICAASHMCIKKALTYIYICIYSCAPCCHSKQARGYFPTDFYLFGLDKQHPCWLWYLWLYQVIPEMQRLNKFLSCSWKVQRLLSMTHTHTQVRPQGFPESFCDRCLELSRAKTSGRVYQVISQDVNKPKKLPKSAFK